MTVFSPKQKIYLTGAAFVVAIVLIFVAVALPLISKIKTSNTTLAEQKSISDDFFQNWKNLESSKKAAQQIQRELSSQSTFLAKNDALNFIMSMENIASATGNQQEISINSEEAAQKDPALGLRMSLLGDFPGLIKFLILMENAPYFNDVEALNITQPSDKERPEQKTGKINSVVDLNVYYQ